MRYDDFTPDQLLSELVNAAAKAGHQAARDFHKAETDLYSDAAMREVREIKTLLQARLNQSAQSANETMSGPAAFATLPESKLDFSALDDRL